MFFRCKKLVSIPWCVNTSTTNYQLIPVNIRHYSLREQLKFHQILDKYNLDLVHFPNFNVPVFYNKPFVVTIHDMVHHKISGAKKSRYVHFLAYKKVIENAAKKSRAVITVSEASKKDIVKILNVVPRKVEVIYEAGFLNKEISEQTVNKIKARYFLQRPYMLFVGVLERKKNVVNLTRGFDDFLKQSKLDMDLVVVGKSDPHYPDIKYEAMDIKHKERLVFTGAVSDEELSALYKGAYAFVNASLHEGFGLPGVEALNFGLPLAVSNTEVFNEVYDNAAVYFNPLDPADIAVKLELLAQDQQFYQTLSKKSFERAQKFNWEKTAEQTLKVYNECINKKL
jgi:glycosyltransferase involved in cell wall biosynthesis